MGEINKRATTGYLIKRLLKSHIGQHTNKVIFAVFCMIIAAAATAGNAWMMEPVLDKIFLERDKEMLMLVPLAILGLNFAKGAASYGQAIAMKHIGQRVVTDMQVKLYDHLLRSDVSFFQENSSGKLLSRFSNDINTIRRSIANIINNTIKESFTLVFLIGLMFYHSITLALIALIVFPLAVYPIVRLGKRMRKVTDKTQEELGDFTAKLDDAFQGIKVVKAYGREQYEVERAGSFIERIFNLYIKAARVESLSSPVMEVLAGFAIAAVVWYGGFQVINGVTTPGAFFSFMMALIMAYKPMKSISGLNTIMQEGLASVKRYFAVLDTEPAIKDTANSVKLKITKPEIIFENVCFSYDKTRSALKDICIKVPAGKRVAIVGESGSGKSTIMNLILRFYDPEKGDITISGVNLKEVTLNSLRQNIAYVNQETFLFDDTVYENIAYGKPGAKEEEIIDAAYAAAAHDFIVELPQGYETLIGQDGTKLSGGQRQRITIARAMLKNAPILLLDEATSSLDPISENQVQVALERLMKGRTTVVIAHRLSTIMSADLIYVVSEGKIAESGTHKKLLEAGGEYKSLFDKQFGNVKA